ncbi:MAG: hypothetical protein ACE5JB_11795 [bacterium]
MNKETRCLVSWYQLFQILKRLEWQGEVRRGYFIEGHLGVQFALPEAVEWLKKLQIEEQPPLSTSLLINTGRPCFTLWRYGRLEFT